MTESSVPADAPAKQIQNLPLAGLLALRLAAFAARLLLASLRIQIAPDALALWQSLKTGCLVAFWHNRILLSPELKRRYCKTRPINALVSASKDGAWLTAFFKMFDVGAIRGSSSWRGGPALLEISRRLREVEDVGITPDGPRGPCYDWKHGMAQLALKTQVPVVLVGIRYHNAWRLKSWDRFCIPKPFSRVEVMLDFAMPDGAERQLPAQEFSENLRRRLMVASGE